MMRIAYCDHVEKIISPMNESGENWTGMKKFWQFIKSMRKNYMGVPALKDKGMTVIDARAKADLLNKQFESVFTKEEDLDATMLFPHESTYQKMTDINITQHGIQKMLENLNPHKATGPDDICPLFLKTLASSIAPILMIVYKKSYNTGQLPDDWKLANVVPVFKKGNTSLAATYRPISLTCVSCKIMEHIITSNVMRHASTHNILYHLQHGFRDKRSCETQLLEFQNDIVANMNNVKQTDVIVMDFAKAFDKVGHRRLIEKMKYYGVGGKTNKWIEDFLAGRSQKVVLDGEKSYNADVLSGVPQGSVLGPCLFLFYINDMPEGLHQETTVRLFADDTIAYLAVTNNQDAEKLQEDLTKLEKWEQTWQMKFHPDKCQVLTITRKKEPIHFDYVLHGHKLEHVQTAKYLGVTISHDMRWNTHVDNIVKKGNQALGFLRRNLQIRSEDLKTTAYNTIVRPHLEYSSSVWDPHTREKIHAIEMVQRRAARYVKRNYRNTSSVGDMLNDLNWQTLEIRRKNQRLTMMYKIHNNLVGIDRDNFLEEKRRILPSHTHCYQYQIPVCTKDYHYYSFFPRATREWNKLSDAVHATTVEAFKAKLSAAAATDN